MDKEVIVILKKYLKRGVSIDDLQSELIQANCIIYKSELPPMNGEAVKFVDATPDEGYPLRILRAYRQQCDCMWMGTTDGAEPFNPLIKAMNDLNKQRAIILDKVIEKLKDG